MPNSHLSRRDFVAVVTAFLGTIMGAVIGLPAIAYLIHPAGARSSSENWIPLAPLEKIPVGVPTLYTFTRTKVNGWEKTVTSHGVYVLRSEDNQVRVFDNTCTHLSCRVAWKPEVEEFVCPCHNGRFDINGNIIEGPQPRPLDTYPDVRPDETGTLYFLFRQA